MNLVLDGLTNTTQDTIYRLHRPYSGPQMMCGLNLISTLLTSVYLILEPFIAATDVGAFFGLLASSSSSAAAGQQQGELSRALDLLGRNPRVLVDVLGFAACGALGQVFICEFFVFLAASIPFCFLFFVFAFFLRPVFSSE